MFRCVGIVNKRQKVLTNVHGSTSHDTCQRYSQTEKKMLNVPMPNLIKEYNAKKGGGYDLLDAMVGCYQVQFRIKKWWWPLYSWFLSVCAFHAWRRPFSPS